LRTSGEPRGEDDVSSSWFPGFGKRHPAVLKCSPEPSVQFSSFLHPVGVSKDGLLAQTPSVPSAASGGCLPPGRGVLILALKLNKTIVKKGGFWEMG